MADSNKKSKGGNGIMKRNAKAFLKTAPKEEIKVIEEKKEELPVKKEKRKSDIEMIKPIESSREVMHKLLREKLVKKSAEKKAPEKAEPKKTVKAAAKAEPKKTVKAAAKAEPKKTVKAAAKAEPKKAVKAAAKTAPKKAVKTATKAEPKKTVKAAAKAAPKKAVKAATKAEPKKAVKPAAKKTSAETKQKVFVQFGGKSEEQSKLVAKAVKIWTKDMKKKEADLSSLDLYVKPEEGTVYIVFNKKERSQFSF